MFTTILGIPAHPLLIHAAVVLVPLLILVAIGYAVWPAIRPRLDWAVAGLAVAAPVSVWFAKVSGQNFRQRLIDRRLASPVALNKIAQHQSYGTKALWWTIALGIEALVLLYLARRDRLGRRPTAMWLAGCVVTAGVAAVAGYYIVRTGDTGAHIVWSGF